VLDAKADDIFLELLRCFKERNQHVGDKSGANYAPAMFAKEDIAKKAGVTNKAFVDAMRRLFAAGKIWNEPCGYPYRPQYRIAVKP